MTVPFCVGMSIAIKSPIQGQKILILFLLHHGVLRQDSLSTNLRVVLDGSVQTTTGVSWNNLQAWTIYSVRFSFNLCAIQKIYICVLVNKMYGQIIVNEEDRNVQCNVWRNSPPPQNYLLVSDCVIPDSQYPNINIIKYKYSRIGSHFMKFPLK